jgi:pyruvate,water dikinase
MENSLLKFTLDWRHPDFAQAPVGGKARALGALSNAGFAVPPWFVVLPQAYHADPLEVLAELDARTAGRNIRWAVRSSALDEDGQTHSFAGQLESYLEVEGENLFGNIQAVWRSGFSERIVLYRRQAGLSLPPPLPAVIIQQMVPAEAAGVAFSADPVSGRRGIAVVAGVEGLGESLVSGEATGDSFHVDRQGTITHRQVAYKSVPVLNDRQVVDIAQLARKAAHHFGGPQDIEWAIYRDALYILQSRPITSLLTQADPDGRWQLWDNSNIAESYSGVTTPLTFSFARHIYEEVYRQFVKILRVPAHRIEANRDVFGRMLGLIRGQIYYNMPSWYRVLAMLPGFAVNRRFMEQMMGVKESLPDEALAGIVVSQKAGWRDYAEIVNTLAGLISNHLLLNRKIRAFYERLEEALKPGGTPLEDMRPDELAAAYRHLQNQLLTRWDAPLINDFFAMIYFGVSRKLVDNWCGDADGTLQNDLITCQGGIISAEPAKRIKHMAEIVRQSPTLRDALRLSTLAEIEAALKDHPAFTKEYRAYLDKFGNRCLEELKLESTTLHDDPLMLLNSIARLADRPAPENEPNTDALAAAAEQRVATALEKRRGRRWLFDYVIRQTRDRVRDRENLRFERTRVFGRVRKIFVELGKRLHVLGLLDEPRDVFFLQAEETLGFVEGTAVTTNLKELARLRKAEFAQWPEASPDGRFETRGIVYVGHDFLNKTAAPASAQGEERKGIGCCPGVIRGRARVILDPRHATIEPGEILVAPRTDPGWIMLFPSAAGLLVEHGSLLSHSAIVAREMGIPAVVSITELTQWLRTGDEVELDGSTGRITRLQSTEEPHA